METLVVAAGWGGALPAAAASVAVLQGNAVARAATSWVVVGESHSSSKETS